MEHIWFIKSFELRVQIYSYKYRIKLDNLLAIYTPSDTFLFMTRRLDRKALSQWINRIGVHRATYEILGCLECSASKAEKIAQGTYRSTIKAAEQKALADMIGMTRDELFPLAAS